MIPGELDRFFGEKAGHSLIIKGEPGSGKTTLALEILNHFRDRRNVLYLSTRVADESLVRQFPWVKDIVKVEVEERKMGRTNLHRLEGLIEEGFVKENVVISGDEAILEVGELLPELERIYDFVETNDGNAMVCVDSIDGLSEKYGIPPEKILYTIQKDIVEPGHGDVIFVMEETSTRSIDYLGDGIVTLTHEPGSSFWRRTLTINKLRGAEVEKPKYLYTLSGGRFRALRYQRFSLDAVNPNLNNLRAAMEKYSGYRCLSLRISEDFPRELVESLILVFASIMRRALVLPPAFYPGESLEKHAEKCGVGEIKVIGYGNDRREIYLEGTDILVELSSDTIRYHGGEGVGVIIGLDSIVQIYGVTKDLPTLIKNLKQEFPVVLITPEEYTIGGGVDYEIRMDVIEDIPVIMAERAYAIYTEGEDGNLNLIPLL